MVTVLFDGELCVQYGFGFLHGRDDEAPDLDDARDGQANGLLGAAVPGGLTLMFGLHTGPEPLRVEWSEVAPALDDQWEDVVEASVEFDGTELLLAAFDEFVDVDLPVPGPHRVRFSASGMDAARRLDYRDDDEAAPDRYLLQLWPGPRSPDAVIRLTSEAAAYWHREASGETHPLTAEEEDLAGLVAAFASAPEPVQRAALLFVLEQVVTAVDIEHEAAATAVLELIRRGQRQGTKPAGLLEFAARMQAESPPIPRDGSLDMHDVAWRRLQAASALASSLTGTVGEVVDSTHGPLYHARYALDDAWSAARTTAIDILRQT